MTPLALLILAAAALAAASPSGPPAIDLRTEFQFRIQGLGGGPAQDAGDVSGDGIPDALVPVAGAPSRVFVVFGRRGWRNRATLGSLRPDDGYQLIRPGPDAASFTATNAGDVNGDTIPDALVGYVSADGSIGEAYVVFGRRVPETAAVDLTHLTPQTGYTIRGPAQTLAGTAVSAAGDVDGDGVTDALVGAPGPDGAAGAVYVVYGRRPAPSEPIDLAALETSEGYRVDGAPGDGLGQALVNAGDVNRDSVPDGLLGAPSASHSFGDAGSVYVVYGQRAESPETVELAEHGSWGYRVDGAGEFVLAGFSLANAGDVDLDGAPDALVGAPGQTGAPFGSAYVVFGHETPPAEPIGLASLARADGYRIADGQEGSGAGYSVAALGDVSADGVPDALIGAIGAEWREGSGAAYVVYGRAGPVEAPIDLAELDPAEGYVIGGIPGANAGWSVARAGDVDGDGTDEAWVWAPNYAPTTTTAGAALLVGLPRPVATPLTTRTKVGRSRAAVVRLDCTAPRALRCTGAVRVLRDGRIVGSAGFSIRPEQQALVRVRLSPGTTRLLRRRGKLRAIVSAVSAADPPAPAVSSAGRLLLTR